MIRSRRRRRRSGLLIVTEHFPPSTMGGGPARSLDAMIAKSRRADEVHVVTSDTEHTQTSRMAVPKNSWTLHRNALVWYGDARSILGMAITFLHARDVSPQTIYINSIFNARFAILPLILHKLGFWGGAQVVVAPRGEADPGALAVRAAKKRAFLAISRAIRLYHGVIWHASAPLEATNIQSLDLTKEPMQILVKENETGLPKNAIRAIPQRRSEVHIVCTGRISPKKNLELVIEALRNVGPGYHLHIAGTSDDREYLRELERRVRGVESQVTWHGHLQRRQLFSLLDYCDAGCFPTKGENFSHAIAEALSRSLPVLVADVTPWTHVIRNGGGILVEDCTAASWTTAFNELSIKLRDDPAQLRADAAAAYEHWAEGTDATSFIDYVLEGRTYELAWKA